MIEEDKKKQRRIFGGSNPHRQNINSRTDLIIFDCTNFLADKLQTYFNTHTHAHTHTHTHTYVYMLTWNISLRDAFNGDNISGRQNPTPRLIDTNRFGSQNVSTRLSCKSLHAKTPLLPLLSKAVPSQNDLTHNNVLADDVHHWVFLIINLSLFLLRLLRFQAAYYSIMIHCPLFLSTSG